jgi:hypothetical protein
MKVYKWNHIVIVSLKNQDFIFFGKVNAKSLLVQIFTPQVINKCGVTLVDANYIEGYGQCTTTLSCCFEL